ncbi:putative uncharacterized protein DDB_G0271606 [Hyalella azteca]|uniref:MIF4G domain-containing protein n=1 Tax=Hyalella azteca TaxID=294128 RepID=A0A8B7N211_HYAAZ|nr:putative uncharacterized protein DDB_G0271606 [Hyalella azteca]
MDDASRLGRGRGRGIAPGEEHRGDLRRPLTTPQELTAAGLQQPPGSNANVKGFNDSRGQPQYSNELKTTQSQLVHSRPALQNPTDQNMHAQMALANQQVQSQHQQLSLPALQQHLVNQQQLANQQQHLANQHHLVNQIQLANQHQMANQQQQMVNQQLVSVAQYVSQQQLLQAQQQQHSHSSQSPQLYSVGGIAASNIPLQQYMDPQKVLEYEELKKKQAQLERIKQEHYKQLEQQQQMEQQQRLQYLRQAQQQKLHNQASAMNALEIEQKLASLQLQNPDAIYLQQSPQQPPHQFIQQQHLELQKQHQQLQQQQYHQQLQQQQQAQLSVLSNQSDMSGSRNASMLSADAAVFVPRFAGADSQQLEVTNGNSKMANTMMPQQISGHMSLIQIQPELAGHPVVIQVDSAVVTLSTSPSKYESIAPQLTRLLSWKIEEENLMREVVTVIFEQGVGEPNFRFTGGKLCEHLVKNVAQTYNGLSFKSILLHRCQEEFEYRHEYLAVQFYERLIGFTYFLAEILTRLLMPSGGPIVKLKEALCEMLNLLLEVSTNESLKCVAQVLKMSGRYLAMGETDDIDAVMTKVRDITMTSLPPNIKSLLMSVVEFQAANWGCNPDEAGDAKPGEDSEEKSASRSVAAANGGLPVLGTVFYGPDGAIQRIEEDCPEDYPSDSDDSASRQSSQSKVVPQVCELDGDEGVAFEQFLMSMT